MKREACTYASTRRLSNARGKCGKEHCIRHLVWPDDCNIQAQKSNVEYKISNNIIKKWRKMCSFCLPWLVSGGTGEWVGAFPVVGVVETGWSAVPDDLLYGRNRGEKAGECE